MEAMKEHGATEVSHVCFSLSPCADHWYVQIVLETEYDNLAALRLYDTFGFIREKRLFRFYLNGKDAFRLVHVVPSSETRVVDDKDPPGNK